MKLEFLDDISNGGKFTGTITDQLIRLYDFDKLQVQKLQKEIIRTIIENREMLHIDKLDFIEALNCKLTLCLTQNDIGITTDDKFNFTCSLTFSGYENMINLLTPFSTEDINGFQWLYNTGAEIDFLLSPDGNW